MECLSQTEHGLDAIINSLPDIIYRLDPGGIITFINRAVEAYGYTAEELIGRDVLELIHPDDRESAQYCLRERRTGDRQTSRAEIRLQTKEHVFKQFEVNGVEIDAPVFSLAARGMYSTNDQQEEIFLGTQGVARDISERKKMQLALESSRENYRLLYEDTPAMLHSIDQSGCLISVSNKWLEVLGFERDEVIGRKSTDFLTAASRKYAQEVVLPEYYKQGLILDIPYQFVKKNGEIIDVLLSATSEKDNAGNIIRSLAVLNDITKSKRAHEEIQKLSAAVEQSPVSVMITDINGTIEYVNPAFLKFTEYTSQDVLGETPRIFNSGVQPKEFYDDLWGTITAGKEWRGEFCNTKKSGEIYWETATISPILGASGEITHYLAFKQDITQRKQIAEALIKSEERYSLAMQAATDGLWDWNVDTGEAYFSPRYFTMLGYNPDELQASYDTWKDLIHPDERENIVSIVQKHIENKSPKFEIEFRLRTKSGDYRWILSRGMVMVNELDGTPHRVIGTHVDITQRKHAEKDRDRLMMAIDQSSDAILITSTDDNIVFVNRALEELSGYDRQELIGQHPSVLMQSDQPESFCLKMAEELRTGLDWTGQLSGQTKGGREYVIQANISPVKNESGEIDYFISVLRDMTLHLRHADQQHQSQKMEAIGRLAGGIAHDFNNHLMAIMANSELMLSQLARDDQLAHYPEEILKIGRRSALLTRQFLAFGPRSQKEMTPVMLSDVIQSSRNMLERLIREDIEMITIIQPDLGIVQADHGQMEQIILNLVLNARDAMPDGGKLTIFAENVSLDEDAALIHPDLTVGDYVTLCVEDTGTGIPDADLEHIFEPYFTTKSIGQGTGLGLATVYGITQQSGGVVTVHTVQGKGTKFSIYFPLINGSKKVVNRPEEGEPAAGHGEQILLVEDEESLRKSLKLALESFGYHVTEAENGQAAIAISDTLPRPIDLVITDIIMPKMNGIELAQHLLKQHPQTKVIFITGHTRDVIIPDDFKASNYNIITKPFSTERLSKRVRALIDAPGDNGDNQ